MAENISPTSLSPVLKETSSVYSETADFLINSREDTVDRLLIKRGLSMTPVLQDVSRSPERSFVNDTCIDEFLVTPKSPLGLKNKSTFRQKSGFAKPAPAKRNTARYSTALHSSTEDNSLSDISFFHSGESADKRKLRQTTNFRNLKRKTGTATQDLSLEEGKSDSSLTSASIEETRRRTNFRSKSKPLPVVSNVFDNVMDSTSCETSFSDTIQRKSTGFSLRSEKAQKRHNETAFTNAFSTSLSSENSSQELSASKRPKRSENSKKFKKVSAATKFSDTLDGFDDAFASDSFTNNMSVSDSQKLKKKVNHSGSNVSQTNDFDDALHSDSFTNSMSSSRSQKPKEKINQSGDHVGHSSSKSSKKTIVNEKGNQSGDHVSYLSSKSSKKTIENEKDVSKTVTDHKLHSSVEEKSANVSMRRSIRSQNKGKNSSTITDSDNIFEVGNQESPSDGNASTTKPPGSINNSLQKSNRSVKKSVSLTNLDVSRINPPNDFHTSFEGNEKNGNFEDGAMVVTNSNHPINKSQLDKSMNSSVLSKSEELSTSSRRTSRKLGKQGNRSVNSSKLSLFGTEQGDIVEKSFVKENSELSDKSAELDSMNTSANTTRRSHDNTSTVSSSDQQNTSKSESGSKMSSDDDSNLDKSIKSSSSANSDNSKRSKSSSQLLSLSASDSLNSEGFDSPDGEKLEASQLNQSTKRRESNVSRSENVSVHKSKESNKSSNQLSSAESKSPDVKEEHDSPAVGKSKKLSARLSHSSEKSTHENLNATHVTENSSNSYSSRSQRNPNAENFENSINVEESNKSSSSVNTTKNKSKSSNQRLSSSVLNSSNAEDQQNSLNIETLNSPSSATHQQSKTPRNKNLSKSHIAANSSNITRTSRSQSKINSVTNSPASTINTSVHQISPGKSNGTLPSVLSRESRSKASPEKFSPEDISECIQENADEFSVGESIGIITNNENISFKRYTFNSENELVSKSFTEHKIDKISKSFSNASNTIIENVDEDDESDEDSIFNERPSIIHSESDNELDDHLVNKSLLSYSVSKICLNETFMKRNNADSARMLSSRSSSSFSNDRKASLRRRSSANKSVSHTASASGTQGYSTVVDMSMFASNLGSSSDRLSDDSGFSVRDSVRLTTNFNKFIKISPKDDDITELDYEDGSNLNNLSAKSVPEEMRLHITDDPPVGGLSSLKLEIDPNDIDVNEPSIIKEDNTENSEFLDENQQSNRNSSTQNYSPKKAAPQSASKTRKSASAVICEAIADGSLDKANTNYEPSRGKSVGRKSDNSSHQSDTTSGESFEINVEDTLGSSNRSSKKRSSGRVENQNTELGRTDKLELSREAIEETAESINESAESKSFTEETKNEDDAEMTNLPGQESINGSMCGETYVSAAASQDETSHQPAYLKDRSDVTSDSENVSSINGTPSGKSAAAGPSNLNFKEYFAKPLYPVNRRVKSLRQSCSSIDSERSSGSLSLLSKCIRKKQRRRSNKQNSGHPLMKHNMNLRRRDEAFPKFTPPKMSRPAYWVTNKLYSFLIEKLEPKFNILAKKKSENFINFLQEKCKKLMKEDDEESEEKIISAIKDQMVELQLVNSDFMFYNFCQEFLPFEIQDKVVPSALPFSEKCNRSNFNPDNLFIKFF